MHISADLIFLLIYVFSCLAGFAAEGGEGPAPLAAERTGEGVPLWHCTGPDQGVVAAAAAAPHLLNSFHHRRQRLTAVSRY